jgi:peroxiredoxin
MFRQMAFIVGLALCSWLPSIQAGQFNRVLGIGDAAPQWADLEGTDGKRYGLASFADAQVLVIAFTCNTCPYALDVEKRLRDLQEHFASQSVVFVAVNVNVGEGDSLEAMRARVKENGFAFPYLRDDSQQMAHQHGAITTPEFYVLDKSRRVAYMGSLDDSPDGSKVGKTYLKSAIEAALVGKEPTVKETLPVGCRIRFARKR